MDILGGEMQKAVTVFQRGDGLVARRASVGVHII